MEQITLYLSVQIPEENLVFLFSKYHNEMVKRKINLQNKLSVYTEIA